MKAFILAGGFATRLWPLTEARAKPLLPLAGKPILSHLVEKIPKEIAVTVSTNDAFEDAFASWAKEQGRPVEIIVERTGSDDRKLGALGAVAAWTKEAGIAEDILLLTGDNFGGLSLEDFLKRYTPGTPLLAAFDIGDLTRAAAFGVVEPEPDGKRIHAFAEKPKEPRSTLVSTGFSVIPAAHIALLQEYAAEHPDNVGGIFEEFLRRGIPVEFHAFAEPWFDIGSFAAYLEASRAIVGDHSLLADGAVLSASQTHGTVVVGKGSAVSDCDLTDVVIFEDCCIENCVLRNCVIDDGCILRGIDLTGKMLRRGTTLAQK